MSDANDLKKAFDKIPIVFRHLSKNQKGGKESHWITLNSIPENNDLSIKLAHFELGHGSAEALANFMIVAMEYASKL